ncbi:MAG: helix-turn-helix domain-containing protein [bacterium]
MNTEQAATYLGISPGTLRVWCSMRKHVPFVKVGRAVRYDRFELDKYIKENAVSML